MNFWVKKKKRSGVHNIPQKWNNKLTTQLTFCGQVARQVDAEDVINSIDVDAMQTFDNWDNILVIKKELGSGG